LKHIKGFRALEEILNIYSKMLGDVFPHASKNVIEEHYRLENEEYQEPRYVHPTILLHNIHVVCHDVITRVSSLRKSRVTVTDIDVSSTC
jgi:hypothetical protein